MQPFASRSTISSLQSHHYELLNKELSEKRRLWQNVYKEFDEETGDDVSFHVAATSHLVTDESG